MRASVIASIFVIGLLGVGFGTRRCAVHPPQAWADIAVPPAPKAKSNPAPKPVRRPVAEPPMAKGPADPVWKEEVLGPDQTKSQLARTDALKAACDAVAEYMQRRYPGYRFVPTPQFLTDRKMVDDGKDEPQTLADADAPIMIRHRLTVEILPEHLRRLLQEDRKLRVEDRLWLAGRALAALLIVLVAFAGYIRLDDWTKGYFSLALKLTAVALAVAGSVVLWWLI